MPIWEEDRKRLDSRRVGAVLVDALVVAPVLVPLNVLFDGLTSGAILVYIALELGYFHVMESHDGQTIGKRLFDLRVVRKADAGPASAKAISGRTVLRLLDGAPFFYVVGGLTMILSGRRRQRLGDLAVGTVVTRASARPYTPARRSALQAAYPMVWLGAAVGVVLLVGYGGDPGLATIDEMCAQTRAAEAKLPPGSAPEERYRLRMALVQQLYGMEPSSKKMLAAGNALISGTLQEMEMVRIGQYEAAASLAQNHHRELADRGLEHC